MTTTGSTQPIEATTRRSIRRTTVAGLAALTLVAGCAAATGAKRSGAPPEPRDSLRTLPRTAFATGTLVLTESSRRPQAMTMVDLLQGRIAGLRVERRAGGGIALQLRGPGSVFGGEPLVVVDGSPLPGGAELGSFLALINPDDVVRVEVLKDPSAAALYGSRAANGVVLISLRHAKGR